MNAFENVANIEGTLGNVADYEEQQSVLSAEYEQGAMKEIAQGRYAYGMGQPLNDFWSYHKRGGWLAAQAEHDATPDIEE